MKICRLCLCQCNDNDNNVESVLVHKIKDLAKKIEECVSIDINSHENLPKFACTDCINQVMRWEVFRNVCQRSNEVLISNLSVSSLKLEETFENVEIIQEEDYYNEEKTYIEDNVTDSSADENEFQLNNLDCLDLQNVSIENNFNYKCSICDLSFNFCFDYLDHQYDHVGKDIFKCDACLEAFSTREEILNHDKTHRVSCPCCCKQILKSSMKLHLIKHSGKYKCSTCGLSCSSRAALKQHIITVHTDIKEHICEVCGKVFSSISAMRVHNKIHSDVRMYQCKLCTYAGRTASALYIHMSTHANDSCVCDICFKTFKSNRNLSDHIRRAHSKNKKHCCVYCNKCFVDKYTLTVHIRWHTNVRPYKCTVCTKAFIRSDGLKEHMNTHTKRTLFECTTCARQFVSKQGMVRHNCLAIT